MKNASIQKNRRNGIMLIIVLAVIFGMASGVVGELVARSYMLNYSIPLFGEIDFSNNNYGGSNLIIRDAKKVIVEQDVKAFETINSVNSSIVGIFRKQATTSLARVAKEKKVLAKFNINDNYQIKNELAQGFIITSDGWIITDYLPKELKEASWKSGKAGEKIRDNIFNNYVVITKDKKIYPVNNIIFDKLSSYSFWHIKTSDLPVRKFVAENKIHNSQLVLAVSWDGWAWIATVIGKFRNEENLVQSSDKVFLKIILDNVPKKEFLGSFLFNLNGDLIGLINQDGEVESISNYTSDIISILKYKKIKRAGLGVNYVDLSNLVNVAANKNNKGCLVHKNKAGIAVVEGGSADLAGIKEGDIIIAIDNIELNEDNNLGCVISRYIAGDEVDVAYLREGNKKEVKVKLGGL